MVTAFCSAGCPSIPVGPRRHGFCERNQKMKRVLVGALLQESNSFSPRRSVWSDFHVDEGTAMLDRIAAAPVFKAAGMEMIPTIFAYAVPGGILREESYLRFKNQILGCIPDPANGDRDDGLPDGVWLYLHGALEVDRIGSGEADLVSAIRQKVGPGIPIAVALDFHANNTQLLMDSANIIYGYRTAPHTDAAETQVKTAQLLIRCMEEGLLPKPVMVRPPLLLPGEMATTGIEPLKSLMVEIAQAETTGGILCASFFDGMAWVDAPNSMASVVVVGEHGILRAGKEARRLAGLFWSAREQFGFEEEAAEPFKAIRMAAGTSEGPVFVTDSGDNVTGGAPGDGAYLLKLLLANPPEKALVAGIACRRGIEACREAAAGAPVSFDIGGELDPDGIVVSLDGILVWKGKILGISGERNSEAAVVDVKGIRLIITAERCAFISPEIIESAGVKIKEYKLVAVKQGYLYDALRSVASRSIMALTPGSCCLDLSQFTYVKVPRPVFPLDRDFCWSVPE
jgi:microcystin degradation protein MlrC